MKGKINGFISRPQKYKCPKCAATKIAIRGCVNPFEFCPKCKTMMQPCGFNLFDKLLGYKDFKFIRR